jgi:Tol biopolymer transport system component
LGGSVGNTTLVWVDREGNETPLAAEPNDYRWIRISPDGTRIALTISEKGNEDIYIWDIALQSLTQLTFDDANSGYPLWTSDSKSILFVSDRNGSRSIYRKKADGTGSVDLISDKDGFPFSFAPDEKSVVLMYSGTSGSDDIGILSLDGDQEIKPLLQEEHDETAPLLSHDGKWMAYISAEEDQPEVYVRPFPNMDDGKWKISTNSGFLPRWSPDGRELYYYNFSEETWMVVAVDTGREFRRSKPKVLFQTLPVLVNNMGFFWITLDVHPDGDRFLMLKSDEIIDNESALPIPRKINIVLNWFEYLKERVPTD